MKKVVKDRDSIFILLYTKSLVITLAVIKSPRIAMLEWSTNNVLARDSCLGLRDTATESSSPVFRISSVPVW